MRIQIYILYNYKLYNYKLYKLIINIYVDKYLSEQCFFIIDSQKFVSYFYNHYNLYNKV